MAALCCLAQRRAGVGVHCKIYQSRHAASGHLVLESGEWSEAAVIFAALIVERATVALALQGRALAAWCLDDATTVLRAREAGTTLHVVGKQLCESLDLRSTATVRDVAASPATHHWPRHVAGAMSTRPTVSHRC